jgi:hypothetical protein
VRPQLLWYFLVVGRAIIASKDIGYAADEFLEQLNRDEIDQFRVTDFYYLFFPSGLLIISRHQ